MKINLTLFNLSIEREPALQVIEMEESAEAEAEEDDGPRIGFTGKVG